MATTNLAVKFKDSSKGIKKETKETKQIKQAKIKQSPNQSAQASSKGRKLRTPKK